MYASGRVNYLKLYFRTTNLIALWTRAESGINFLLGYQVPVVVVVDALFLGLKKENKVFSLLLP